MSGFVSAPRLPDFDPSKPIEQQWKEMTRTLTGFFGDVQHRLNSAFMKDGSEPMKVVTTTLPAGTTYLEGRVKSDTINAYLNAGNWRSWDTARPSWRITQDMANDRVRVERAAATTGNLAWVTGMQWPTPLCRMRRTTSNQSIPNITNRQIELNQVDEETVTGMGSISTFDIGAPVAGWYLACGTVSYATNATGQRNANLYVDGSPADASGGLNQLVPGHATVRSQARTVWPLKLALNQRVSIYAYQDSGGALNAVTDETMLSLYFLGA